MVYFLFILFLCENEMHLFITNLPHATLWLVSYQCGCIALHGVFSLFCLNHCTR